MYVRACVRVFRSVELSYSTMCDCHKQDLTKGCVLLLLTEVLVCQMVLSLSDGTYSVRWYLACQMVLSLSDGT